MALSRPLFIRRIYQSRACPYLKRAASTQTTSCSVMSAIALAAICLARTLERKWLGLDA